MVIPANKRIGRRVTWRSSFSTCGIGVGVSVVSPGILPVSSVAVDDWGAGVFVNVAVNVAVSSVGTNVAVSS